MKYGWLVAAAAMVMSAAPASAADFLTYRFDVSGQGFRAINQPSGLPIIRQGPLDATIEFTVPSTGFGSFNYSAPLFGPRYVQDTYTGSITANSLRITEGTASYTKGPNRSFTIDACGAFGGLSGSFSIALDPSCTAVSFFRGEPLGQFGGDGASFTGIATRLTVTEGFGTPATLGLINAPIMPVPEPNAWAMMILGFGAIGGTLRRRKRLSIATAMEA